MRRLPIRSVAVLILAIVVAFAVRVIPSYHAVMTTTGVNFQDNDSWYHMRTVHNIAAHFPHQSGFDPYAIFPGRQTSHTEPWDVFIAAIAWLLGFGRPSDWLIDQVGAWLPAVLGALLPIPLYFLARRLFGESAARWTAIATAGVPGALVWTSHLGVPDHHVAECLLSVCALVSMCRAVESTGRGRLKKLIASGILFGIYLCVRPAGIFVPATLTLAALFEPVLAPFVAAAMAIAATVFLTSSGSLWASYTWLTLAGSIAVCLLTWGLGAYWRKRSWPEALMIPGVGIAAAAAIGIVALAEPRVFGEMVAAVGRYLPGRQNIGQSYAVAELIPLWQVPPGGLATLFEVLGSAWLPAIPVLLFAFYAILSSRRPVLVLCAVWGLVMTVAGVIQMRMWVYGGPALAVAAGVGCAWLMARLPQLRTAISVSTAAFLLLTSIPFGIWQSHTDGGPRSDWRLALTWLRRNTPEPLGDPDAWLRYWPALKPNQNFAYPASAYGVLTWWDYGDWVDAIGHRIPTTNGTQDNAGPVAAYLTATSPEMAQPLLSQLSARYAVLNSEVIYDLWDVILHWANRDASHFERVIFESGQKGILYPLKIYLPDYYRSMAVHMYNFDGRRIVAPPEVSVFTTRLLRSGSGQVLPLLDSERKFSSANAASQFIRLHRGESMFLGSRDPMVSCLDVDALPNVQRVFASSEPAGRQTVKIFELKP